MDELVFEDLGLAEALRVSSGPRPTCLILDLGFSTSTVIPYNDGKPIVSGIKRVTVGGKLMTNFMKEQISYRYFDMTEETWLVNIIREQMCYVSSSFLCELRKIQ
jgi:actin-related protein 6